MDHHGNLLGEIILRGGGTDLTKTQRVASIFAQNMMKNSMYTIYINVLVSTCTNKKNMHFLSIYKFSNFKEAPKLCQTGDRIPKCQARHPDLADVKPTISHTQAQ